MPLISRWMIRLALFYMWLGFGLGALLLTRKDFPNQIPAYTWRWLPAHLDILLAGWMVQLSLGVAYWIFPRKPFTLTQRGRVPFAAGAAILLNTGIWLHAGAVLVSPWQDFMTLSPIGICLQVAAILAFGVHILPRIRPTILPANSAKT